MLFAFQLLKKYLKNTFGYVSKKKIDSFTQFQTMKRKCVFCVFLRFFTETQFIFVRYAVLYASWLFLNIKLSKKRTFWLLKIVKKLNSFYLKGRFFRTCIWSKIKVRILHQILSDNVMSIYFFGPHFDI